MVCFNSSILPVIALPFGVSEDVTHTETTAKRASKKTDVKYTWLVFQSKTPNVVYILESENSTDVIVPKLSELVNRPKITLNGLQNFESALSAKTILKMIEFFSSPLNEIEGITPLTLMNSGMITKDLFLKTVKDHLSVALHGSNGEVTDDKLIEFTCKVASYKLGLSTESESLGDRVKRHLLTSAKKAEDPKNKSNTEKTFDLETGKVTETPLGETPKPIIRKDDKTEIETPKPNLNDITQNANTTVLGFNLDKPLEQWVKKELSAYCDYHKIAVNKKAKLADLLATVENHLTAPIPENNSLIGDYEKVYQDLTGESVNGKVNATV